MSSPLVTRMIRRLGRHWRGLVLLALVVTGLVLASWYSRDLAVFLEWGDRIADQPWAMVGVVVLMAVLFSFALPGSLAFWLIAPFHPPLVSVAMLLAGSLPGALGAYFLSRRLGRQHAPRGGERLLELLQRRGDLLTQTALRILPGFPHSVVNFAGGILRLPLGSFLLAALVGLAVKWGVYSSAVYGAVEAIETGEPLQLGTVLPLFALTALLLLGALARRRLDRRSDKPPP
ncbi:TVP38/TMEM64 family protein [Thioalkalivibrio paradoxus]|uniref:Sulfurtransferase n=1 Tax=Thioalkalivibrio paradoxus ARh 1 TaxID=713585 RepID=W0DNF0_9GAMM|nr:VTT domain-containing protein [Thioalkalivibrio paradoxus]AHE98405.1 sulfurtransferase [Thioalkalivibrio paradoxus ARh 1]